jgi:hypothetical protein
MKDRDRRQSGRLMLISPERVFYAGLLGRPRKRTSGGYNIYAAMRGHLKITEGKSELVGEVAVVPPYVPHSVLSEHPSIICLVIEPETVEPSAMEHLSARVAGADAPDIAQRIRNAYESLRLRGAPQRLYHRGIRPAMLRRGFARSQHRSPHPAIRCKTQRFLRQQDDRGRLRRVRWSVAVAVPASVQGTDRRFIPCVPRLETCAASAAFRQRRHQSRASGAAHRLSRFDAFQPLDPPLLWPAAARDLFRIARSRDLPQ